MRMDEQKATKELERHIQFLRENWKPHPDYNVIEAHGMAINALEKQVAKKVCEEEWIYTKCDCGYEFSRHHGDGFYTVPYHKKTNYCPNCGQKLDWSEV